MNDDTTRMLERLAETFPERPAPLPELVRAAHAGRQRRTRRNVALAAGRLVLAVAAGVAAAAGACRDGAERSTDRIADTAPAAPCDKQDPQPPSEPVPSGPDYPTNAAGQTYGSARDNSRQPDLVAAIGDCGRTGYIERAALGEQPPWEPGAGALGLRSTPVYESDGRTRIDTFTQSPGTTVADGVDGSTRTRRRAGRGRRGGRLDSAHRRHQQRRQGAVRHLPRRGPARHVLPRLRAGPRRLPRPGCRLHASRTAPSPWPPPSRSSTGTSRGASARHLSPRSSRTSGTSRRPGRAPTSTSRTSGSRCPSRLRVDVRRRRRDHRSPGGS